MLALAQHLIDQGYFRAGGEEYVEENGSYGLSTLLRDHVRLRRDSVDFDYRPKVVCVGQFRWTILWLLVRSGRCSS